jgi:predicted transcriptional regulator
MGELPGHYELEHSSMDCYDCTAFAAHSHDREKKKKKHYPDLYKDYQEKIRKVHSVLAVPMEHYIKLLD